MKPKRKKATGARAKSAAPNRKPQRGAKARKRPAPGRRSAAPAQRPRKPKSPPRQTGRPLLLTPEIRTRICELVADGMRPTPAAATLDIPAQTLSSWRKTQPDFERALEKADALYLDKLLKASDKIVNNDDNLSAAGAQLRFLMERRFPAEYGPKMPDVNVNTNINAPLVLSAAQLEAIQAKRKEGLKR
ncbi:MAG: hypothetical protein NTU84_00730 [Verrucomicrobia bacterium]|nr:hypothetical protein [Verrucomicrobiota bacterium]